MVSKTKFAIRIRKLYRNPPDSFRKRTRASIDKMVRHNIITYKLVRRRGAGLNSSKGKTFLRFFPNILCYFFCSQIL